MLHVDLDQFLVAVELLRRPELAGRPVVVGGRGDPTQRGVVSTASYEARAYGVGSGTPLRVAARRLPSGTGGAVFLPVDMASYEHASSQVMRVLRSFPVDVEVLGWDEAFLGPRSETEAAPRDLADQVRAAVLADTGLTCSVGIGDNKLQAKLATDFGKPDGVGSLSSEEWEGVMGPRPVDALWGVGSRTRSRLGELGIHTVAELAATPAVDLAQRFGPRTGPWLRRLGRGVDTSPVDPTPWVPRGHSREVTLQEDTADWTVVAEHARHLAERVAQDIAAERRPAARVGVKIRFRPFTTRQRSLTLPVPTGDPGEITRAVLTLLERFDHAREVRLIGVRAEMVEPGSDDPSDSRGSATAPHPDGSTAD